MNPGLLILLAVGAYYLYTNSSTANRVMGYQNAAGQSVTTIQCGGVVRFDVPGYNTVWLTQTQNGQPQFDGPMTVPMPPYTLSCSHDLGTYVAFVYQINPDGTKGQLIQGNLTCLVTP